MTLKSLLMAAAIISSPLMAVTAAAEPIPPAAVSWLRCSALGALAAKGAPDAISRKASELVHRRYEELFTAYLIAMDGKSAKPRVTKTRVAQSIAAMIANRKMVNKLEQPILLACTKDLDRLTADIPDTVKKMVAATPRPTQTSMQREMWATCSVALSWGLESGLTSEPEVRTAARRYRQLFQGMAKQQGMDDAEIKEGLDALKKIAAQKPPNELKSAIASCVRAKP